MTRLEKNAWMELICVAGITVIMGLAFTYLVSANASGISYVIILILASSFTAAIIGPIAYKDEAKYDEREKKIRHRAFTISAITMFIFLMLMCFVPFFLIGGKGSIRAYYLPMIFMGCLFIAQAVQSAIILFQCAKEEIDE